jgi:hypothetical protein
MRPEVETKGGSRRPAIVGRTWRQMRKAALCAGGAGGGGPAVRAPIVHGPADNF